MSKLKRRFRSGALVAAVLLSVATSILWQSDIRLTDTERMSANRIVLSGIDGSIRDTVADEQWRDLLSVLEISAPASTQPSLVHFMQQIADSRASLRKAGQEFWRKYPNDARRYQWLLLTVALPPSYAVDSMAWASEEARIGPNRALVDHEAKAAWDAEYAVMRNTFWAAPETTDPERRLLWSAEIRQKLLWRRAARARGETIDQPDQVLAAILQYAESFGGALENDNGDNNAAWYLASLTDLVIARDDVVSLSAEQRNEFGLKLIETGHGAAVSVGQRVVSDYQAITWGESASTLRDHFESAELSGWDDWYQSEDQDHVLAALFYDVLYLPAFGQPRTKVGFVLHSSDREIASRRFGEIGLDLWSNMSRAEQRAWLHWTLTEFPQFLLNVGPSLGDVPEKIVSPEAIDTGSRTAMDTKLKARIEEYLAHADTEPDERSYFRLLEVRRSVVRLMRRTDQTDENIEQTFDDIRDLHVNFHHPDAVQFITWIQSNPARYGVSTLQLRAFFESITDDAHGDMRNLVRVALDPTAFEKGPFEFAAQTLDGEAFDIKSLRGRIVLVDHWTTSCGACIAAFPLIHEIYLRYKDRGFEVVSIAYDGTSAERQIRRIKDEMGLTWTTIDGEGLWNSVASRYLYTSYPQYMLLDRSGVVAFDTEDIDLGRNLENLLNTMLATEFEATD